MFACLHVLLVPAWVFGFQLAPQSKDMYVNLLTTRVSGRLSLYVGPVTDWRPVQGVPRRSQPQLNDSWDRLQLPHDPVKDKRYR